MTESKQNKQNNNINKVVLAYSGGLDTSVILLWLKEKYGCEVATFTADIGQGGEIAPARDKAQQCGACDIFLEDLREVFVADYVWPMFRANAVYEHEYLLGTSIARPLIAKRQVEIAAQCNADAVAHGATGKGNDQVRFELGYLAHAPDIRIVAPWREWDLNSREKLLAYAKKHGIPIEQKSGRAPYSMDGNLLHISYEGNELEDPAAAAHDDMWQRTCSIGDAPDAAEEVRLEFLGGDLVAINNEKMSAAELLTRLNEMGGRHGIGRADIVESRYVGMKSRGCYETPGGTILLRARTALEQLVLDREVLRLQADLMPRYAGLVYNGYWFSPERVLLQKLFDEAQVAVCGSVDLRLHKGNVIVCARHSASSLFDEAVASFEDDGGVYDQRDAAGFIRLNALRLRIAARKKRL